MKRIAFLFPGQGSQYVGMGKSLYETHAIVKETFDEANRVLGFNLKQLCFHGDIQELTQTENAQPALLTSSIAAYRVFEDEIGAAPLFCAGHSLGEISALTCAEAISFSDALELVRQRGKLMKEAAAQNSGGMIAVTNAEFNLVEEICAQCSQDDEIVQISNYNAPSQVVISGHKKALDKAQELLTSRGATPIPLNVSGAFHSIFMEKAAINFQEILKSYSFAEPRFPVLSNVIAQIYESANDIVQNLTAQIVEPIQWHSCIKFLEKNNVELSIELGPKRILTNLMKKNSTKIIGYPFEIPRDIDIVRQVLQDKTVLKETDTTDVITKCLAAAVCTKNRNWNDEDYRQGVILPYKKLQEIKEEVEKSGKEPTNEQISEALELVKMILTTKKLPQNEFAERLHHILIGTGLKEIS